MRQFDVFRNPSRESRHLFPFVVALQSHFVELDTVVVAPLVIDKRNDGVDIEVELEEAGYVVALSELGAVSRFHLARRLGSLADREDEIRRSLDRLFSGF